MIGGRGVGGNRGTVGSAAPGAWRSPPRVDEGLSSEDAWRW